VRDVGMVDEVPGEDNSGAAHGVWFAGRMATKAVKF